jgi:formate C-acetyltransferase
MLDAMVHPEAHKSLIVRVGGFSEYFIRLDPAMQKSIIERTEF